MRPKLLPTALQHGFAARQVPMSTMRQGSVGNLFEQTVPKQLCGAKGHRRQISAEFISIFSRSNSRMDRSLRANTIALRGRCLSRCAGFFSKFQPWPQVLWYSSKGSLEDRIGLSL